MVAAKGNVDSIRKLIDNPPFPTPILPRLPDCPDALPAITSISKLVTLTRSAGWGEEQAGASRLGARFSGTESETEF